MQYEMDLTYANRRRSEALYISPILAYRFQKPHAGIFFKVQYLLMLVVKDFSEKPFYQRYVGKLTHYPGLAFGYSFHREKP